MAKRKTKEQREAEQYAALRQRVADICDGACGYVSKPSEDVFDGNELSRIVPVIEAKFIVYGEGARSINANLFQSFNLNNYIDVDTITEFLFRNNVRA